MKGKVFIVGAGPGDPELLTLKAFRILQTADVVLSDRLVSPEILSEYVPPATEIVYVGKQCRRGASTPQATINELMVIYASEGKFVVRLKGGDVSIFSNVLDELETLVHHNVPYEIVPGVTAALGAAAYSGIPLTARDHATAVRFLTAYKSDVVSEAYWRELAQTDDTLVFYMSSETLSHVVSKLTLYGIDAAKQLAVVEQATTPHQQVHVGSLYNYQQTIGQRAFASPTLVIIGKVVALHRQFSWLPTGSGNTPYFTSLYEVPSSTKQILGLTA
jgi:uroporphyrin-III C-methyltransferase/precorrin-2 dehydrogenase/sirohydrochlorin ferrochelatase/uroporphyrin-III C-methyltransferase